MVFRVTSRSNRRACSGLTLVELMVSMGIGAIVASALAVLVFYSSRSMAAMLDYSELDRQSQMAMNRMAREIRTAGSLTSYTSNQLVFAYDGSTLTYTYSPSSKTLSENAKGSVTVLLRDVQTFSFDLFKRSVASNSFNQFPATNAAEARAIVLNWTCSRPMLNLANTESARTARIVLRNPQ